MQQRQIYTFIIVCQTLQFEWLCEETECSFVKLDIGQPATAHQRQMRENGGNE